MSIDGRGEAIDKVIDNIGLSSDTFELSLLLIAKLLFSLHLLSPEAILFEDTVRYDINVGVED